MIGNQNPLACCLYPSKNESPVETSDDFNAGSIQGVVYVSISTVPLGVQLSLVDQPSYQKLPETVIGKSHLVGYFAVFLFYLDFCGHGLMCVRGFASRVVGGTFSLQNV